MPENDEWMTAAEIAKAIGTSEYSVNRAIALLGLAKESKKDLADRRRIIYPSGTLEKVRQWLEEN